MNSIQPVETSNSLVDQAAQSADDVIKSTQRVANDALNRVTDQASAMAHRGADTLRLGSQQLRDKARHASDSTVTYIKAEPVKAMLIAAATGAALMALVSLMSRSHR